MSRRVDGGETSLISLLYQYFGRKVDCTYQLLRTLRTLHGSSTTDEILALLLRDTE